MTLRDILGVVKPPKSSVLEVGYLSAPQRGVWALFQGGRMCLPAVGLGQTQTCQGGTMACQCKLGPVQGLQELGFPCVKAKLPTGGNEPVPRKPPWQSECAISMQMSPYSQGVSAALAWEHAGPTLLGHV